MFKLLLLTSLIGFLGAFPTNPWSYKFVQRSQPIIYVVDGSYFDPTIFQQRSEDSFQQRSQESYPVVANLMCANIPLEYYYAGPLQTAANQAASISQSIAQSAVQGAAQQLVPSVLPSIPKPFDMPQRGSEINREREKMREHMEKIPEIDPMKESMKASMKQKQNEENRDIPMIKLPIEARASETKTSAEQEASKEVDVPEPNDKAIPVGSDAEADDEVEH